MTCRIWRNMKIWSRCHLYDWAHVKNLSPTTPGIYRLLVRNRIFYIGQCRNIHRRLFEHLKSREGNRCIRRYLQKYHCFFRFAELESAGDLLTAEREQIRKYKPPCNMDIRTIEENARAPKPYREAEKDC